MHPVEFIQQQDAGLVHVLGIAGAQEFQVAADHRHGGTEFMAGVVHKPALVLEAGLEPLQHVVEVHGKLGNIVHGCSDLHAFCQVLERGVLRGFLEAADRAEQASRDDVAHPTGHRECCQGSQGVGPHGPDDLVPLLPDLVGDHQETVAGPALQPD
ncbi:hypothetical protein FQZ97_1003020 [compost metagenome]